jgi:hypothetical protein
VDGQTVPEAKESFERWIVGQIWWEQFQQIKARFPLLRPKLYLRYAELQAIAAL